LIPANLLTPGKQYQFSLSYIVRLTTPNLGWSPASDVGYIEFGRQTLVPFTAGR